MACRLDHFDIRVVPVYGTLDTTNLLEELVALLLAHPQVRDAGVTWTVVSDDQLPPDTEVICA